MIGPDCCRSLVSLYWGEKYLIYQVFACQKQPFNKKSLKQFLYTYVPWVVPATPRMAKMNGNRNHCAPKITGTHNWLTPWCFPMSDPSSSQYINGEDASSCLLVEGMLCALQCTIIVINPSRVVRYFVNHRWEKREVGRIQVCCEEAVDVPWTGAEEKIHCLRCR
jgi:hypothetical protein